jgi:hypothetical protein
MWLTLLEVLLIAWPAIGWADDNCKSDSERRGQ